MTERSDPYTGHTIDHNGIEWDMSQLTSAKLSDLQTPGFIDSISSDASISAKACEINIDRFCNINIDNASHGYDMIFWCFSPFALVSAYSFINTGIASNTYSAARLYGLPNLKPKIYCDGKVKIAVDQTAESISADVNLNNAMYGTYVNGSHRIGVDFILGSNGEMNIEHGHGIYAAQENFTVTLNGGRVIGDNGITIRGGKLVVPSDANPMVISNADYAKYNPAHASGQAGAGIFLGHAVLIEACADVDTGYGLATAEIKSGYYISRNNTSIASVAAAKAAKDWASNKTTYNRLSGFVEGGMLNRIPSNELYEIIDNIEISNVYAKNTDYGIVAQGFATSTPTMIIKQDAI